MTNGAVIQAPLRDGTFTTAPSTQARADGGQGAPGRDDGEVAPRVIITDVTVPCIAWCPPSGGAGRQRKAAEQADRVARCDAVPESVKTVWRWRRSPGSGERKRAGTVPTAQNKRNQSGGEPMKSLSQLSLAGALALSMFTAPAFADTVILKMANVTSLSAKDAGLVFKQVAEEASNGTLTINLFPDNQLGDDRTVVESTVFGDIDISVSSTSPLATMFADLFVFDAPFLFLSPDDAYTALDGKGGQEAFASLEDKGLKGLTFWENGFRNLTNNNKEVHVPAELDNMKIRVMQNEVQLAAWKAFGANPTPMAFTELFTALQQGTVDGQENPLGIIDGNKFQEVQKYLSLTGHVYTPYIVVMNLDKFNALDETQQAAIMKATEESTAYQRARSQELEEEILVKVQDEGMIVTELSPEQKAAWQQKIIDANLYDDVKAKMDHPEILDQLLAK
ncbi:DctP family TRAP transporter solute-binding subunit [Roseospira visakhapatnamensis]|uniref:Tripartite ATP-independent transporter DctP family solute receptor n=1 Tax=Roseospira visakhapatnamensis TaxID=390880 RepID=A0A7W6REP5_9PROT|nr:DctP family TRAP transporter solute-binding subunit [Roseospira visakhapatnamensis]MBB4267098.1 tripartite ATP-independent transporter DctP family solute receptor [Roseospira visakhapatnamensis]